MLYEVITNPPDVLRRLRLAWDRMLADRRKAGGDEIFEGTRNLLARAEFRGGFVITSYSIHYTKLYDQCGSAELSASDKNALSHRGQALRQLMALLQQRESGN